MYVARILYPVTTLGPGQRLGIWLAGCKHKCPGCCSPELWELQQERYRTSPEDVFKLVEKIAKDNIIDGVIFSGGEPMLQEKELNQLIRLMKPVTDDIIVYTGYQLEELKLETDLLSHISVLIDGRYKEQLNDGSLLRGSSNQRIHILDPNKKEKYEEYIKTETANKIQNFIASDGSIISVGIHRRENK